MWYFIIATVYSCFPVIYFSTTAWRRNREYYMATRRYEISLRVLKNISQVSAANEWNIFSRREEKFRISKWPCNVLLMYYVNSKELTNHFTLIGFGVKGAIYYEAIAMVIFLHVKITCYFHLWRYQVFVRKLTWYFIGVYIIN